MWFATILLLSFLFAFQSDRHTDLSDSVRIGPESSITVKGSSTLHDWDAVSTSIQLRAQVPQGWFRSDRAWSAEELKGIEANVPVESLESGRNKMNRDLRKALRSEQHPEISFRSLGADQISFNEDSSRFEFRINGSLSIAGEQRDIPFTCTMDSREDQRIHTLCETEINMTDFGVQPPTAFFGVLKTDERVTVTVDLTLLPVER